MNEKSTANTNRIPRFSLRSLFLITAALALILGSLDWGHQMLLINPASESVISNDEVVPVDWTEIL